MSDNDSSLTAWPAVEQRELQEKDFIRNLVERISDNYESSGRDSTLEDPNVEYAMQLVQQRASLLLTEMERIIRFKCVNLPSSVHDLHSHDHEMCENRNMVCHGDLVAFLMRLLGRALTAYMEFSCAEAFSGPSLSKKMYPRIMSTAAGTVFFLSQFQPDAVAKKMAAGCGDVVARLCHLCPAAVLSHMKALLDKCLLPDSEEKGIFYMLQSIKYLDLNVDGLCILFEHISEVIRPPEQAWRRTAMLDLNAPLRTCVMRWIHKNPHELRAVYEVAADNGVMYQSRFEQSVKVLLDRLEPWGVGSKKRSMVWPTVCLLLCLVPSGLKESILNRTARSSGNRSDPSVEVRLLRRTLDHLSPDLRQIMFRNRNAHLFSELSVVSLVLMAQSAACLLRARIRAENKLPIVEPQPLIVKTMLQRGLSFESVLFFVDFFKKQNFDKMQEAVLGGGVPSALYLNMITGQGNAEISDFIRHSEFSPSSVVVAYFWSVFYIDIDRFYHSIVHILRPPFVTPNVTVPSVLSVLPTHFLRVNALKSVECVIRTGAFDGSEPMKFLWGSIYGEQLAYCVLSIVERFVISSLTANVILGNGEFGKNDIHQRSRYILLQHVHAACHVDICVDTAASNSRGRKSRRGMSEKAQRCGAPDCEHTRSMIAPVCMFDSSAQVVLCLRIMALCPGIIFMSRQQHVINDFAARGKGVAGTSTHTGVALGGNLLLDNALFRSADVVCVCLSLLDLALCVGHDIEDVSADALTAFSAVLQKSSLCQWDRTSPTIGVVNISSVLLRTLAIQLFSTDGPTVYSASYKASYYRRCRNVLIAMVQLLAETNPYILSALSKQVNDASSGLGRKRKNSETHDTVDLNSASILAHYLAMETAEAGLLIVVCSCAVSSSTDEVELAKLAGQCLEALCDRNKILSVFETAIDQSSAPESVLPEPRLPDNCIGDSTVYTIYRSIAKNLADNKPVCIDEDCDQREEFSVHSVLLLSTLLNHCIHRPSPLKEGEAGLGLVWAVQAIANRWKYTTKHLSSASLLGVSSNATLRFVYSDNPVHGQSNNHTEALSGAPSYFSSWNNGTSESIDSFDMSEHFNFRTCISDKGINRISTASSQKNIIPEETSYFDEWVRDLEVLVALGECLNICPEDFPQFDTVLDLSLASVEERTTEEDIAAYMNPESVDLESFLGDTSTPVDFLRKVVLREKQALLMPTLHELCSTDQLVEDVLNILVFPHCENRVVQSTVSAVGVHMSSALILSLFSYATKILEALFTSSAFGATHVKTRVSSFPVPMAETSTHSNSGGANEPGVENMDRDSGASGLLDRSSHPLFVDLLETPLSDEVSADIKNLSSFQVVHVLNAMLTTLLLIFDRNIGSAAVDDSIPLNSTFRTSMSAGHPDQSRHLRESIDLVEGMVIKIISIAAKAENESVSGTCISIEYLFLQKKITSLATLLLHEGRFNVTKRFRVFLISTLLDWVYNGTQTNSWRTINIKSPGNVVGGQQGPVDTLSREETAALVLSVHSVAVKALTLLLDNFNLSVDTVGLLAETNLFSWINTDVVSDGACQDTVERYIDLDDDCGDVTIRSKVFYRLFHVFSTVFAFYGRSEQLFISLSCDHNGVSKRVQPMIDEILISSYRALASVLHANMDVGFHHLYSAAAGVGTTETQAAMVEVFATTLAYVSTGEDCKSGEMLKVGFEDHLVSLFTLLFSKNMEVATVLCYLAQGKDAEILSRSFLTLCNECFNENVTISLLRHLVRIEVHNTDKLGTLFRSESMPTKFVNMYLGSVGNKFLADVLQDPLREFVTRQVCIDIDSNCGVLSGAGIVEHQEKLLKSASVLQQEAEIFLQCILGSTKKCPEIVKCILSNICTTVFSKFGESDESIRVVVAGSVFLRFFCPAIAMPAKYGISVTGNSSSDTNLSGVLPRPIARGLLMVAKCLQHIVNCTKFTEEHLTPLNGWISEHSAAMGSFCREMSGCSDTTLRKGNERPASPERMSEVSVHKGIEHISSTVPESVQQFSEAALEAMSVQHAFLYTNKDTILRILLEKHENEDSNRRQYLSRLSGDESLKPRPILRSGDAFSTINHIGLQKFFSLDVPLDVGKGGMNTGDITPAHESLLKLLEQLGEPTANIFAPSLEQFVATASGASMLLEQSTDEYFRSVEGQPGFTEALAHVKKQRIVYVSGVSRAPAPNSAVDQPSPNCTMMVWFILRRVDDTTRLSILFYIVLKEAMILRKAQQSFDVILDSTLFDRDSALQDWPISSWWNKLRMYISDVFDQLARKIYVVHPSDGFIYMARKILKAFKIKTKLAGELCEVVSVPDLFSEAPVSADGCPYLTKSLSDKIMYRWPVLYNNRASTVAMSGKFLVLETPDTFGGKKFVRCDTLNFEHVSNVLLGTAPAAALLRTSDVSSGFSPIQPLPHASSHGSANSNRGNSPGGDATQRIPIQAVINQGVVDRAALSGATAVPRRGSTSTYSQKLTVEYSIPNRKGLRALVLQTSQFIQLHSMLSASLSSIKQQSKLAELSREAGARTVMSDAIPGSLLHLALFQLSSSAQALRTSGYSLLDALNTSFSLELALPLYFIDQIHIPKSTSHFVACISEQLSISRPELIVEFAAECLKSMASSTIPMSQKISCMMYLRPWIITTSNLLEDAFVKTKLSMQIEKFSTEKVKSFIFNFLNEMLEVYLTEDHLVVLIDQSIWTLIGQQVKFAEVALHHFIDRMKALLSSTEHASIHVDPLLGGVLPRTKSSDGERLLWTSKGGFTLRDVSPVKKADLANSTVYPSINVPGDSIAPGVESPLRLNANIREAIQGNVAGNRVSDPISNPTASFFDSGSTTGISGPMASLTNAFVAISTQQKVPTVAFLIEEMTGALLKINVLTHNSGISLTVLETPSCTEGKPPSTPQKRASDMRPTRLRSSPNSAVSAGKSGGMRTKSKDFVAVKNVFVKKADKIRKYEVAATSDGRRKISDLPFYARSLESSSSDDFDEGDDIFCPSDASRAHIYSNDADVRDMRGKDIEESLLAAKGADMPFSKLPIMRGDSVLSEQGSKSASQLDIEEVKTPPGGVYYEVGPVDRTLIDLLERGDPKTNKISYPHPLGNRPPVKYASHSPSLKGKRTQFWLRPDRVRLNHPLCSQHCTARERLANSWNLSCTDKQIDLGAMKCDIDSIWASALTNVPSPAARNDLLKSTLGSELSVLWDEMTLLLRNLVPLLFQSSDLTIQLCSDLFFMIISSFGRGPLRFRHGLYSLACNAIHAIYIYFCNTHIMNSDEENSAVKIIESKLVQIVSPHYRHLFCESVEIGVSETEVVIDLFSSVCVLVSEHSASGAQNCRVDWMRKCMRTISYLSPSPHCFRHVLAIGSLLNAGGEEMDATEVLSVLLKSTGMTILSSSGTAQKNVLLDSSLQSLSSITRFCSTELLRSLFWFSLVVIQWSSDDAFAFPLELLLQVVREVSSRRLKSDDLFEDDLVGQASDIPSAACDAGEETHSPSARRRSGSLSNANRHALFDILTELGTDSLMGISYLTPSVLSYSISLSLLRCGQLHNNSCVQLLRILESMYCASNGVGKYGISGYSCVLSCLFASGGVNGSTTHKRDDLDEETACSPGFFGITNFPCASVAAQYMLLLLCALRFSGSMLSRRSIYRKILDFISAMPFLALCLHDIVFEELSREYDRGAVTTSDRSGPLHRCIEEYFKLTLPSNSAGNFFDRFLVPVQVRQKLGTFEKPAEHGGGSCSDDCTRSTPPCSPHSKLPGGQWTPHGIHSEDSHVVNTPGTVAISENISESILCAMELRNVLNSGVVQMAGELSSEGAFPGRIKLVSLSSDILRLAILDVEYMAQFTAT